MGVIWFYKPTYIWGAPSCRNVPDLDKSLSMHVAALGNGGAELMAALLLRGAEINEPCIMQWHVGIKFQAGRVSADGIDVRSTLF